MKKFKRPALMLLVGALVVAVIQYVNREPEVNVEEELFGQYRLLTKYRAMAQESAGLAEDDKLGGEAAEFEKRLLTGSGPALASAELQRVVSDHGTEAGLSLLTVRPLTQVEAGEFVEVPLMFEFRGRIQGLRNLIRLIETEPLGLRVSRLSVAVVNIRQPEDLNIKIAVHGMMRL